MYPGRYFAPRYFAPRYFEGASGSVGSAELAGLLMVEPWLGGRADVEPWLEAALLLNDPQAVAAGTAPWAPSASVVLLADAIAQAAGSQVVSADIGPDGTLGATSSVEATDPTLTTGPVQWYMGGAANQYLRFGTTLESTFESAAGFTVVLAINLPSDVADAGVTTGGIHVGITQPGIIGSQLAFTLYFYEGVVWGDVYYDQALDRYEDASGGSVAEGTHVVAFDYLPSRAFGDRIRLWLNGAQITTAHSTLGTDGALDATGLPIYLGSDLDFGIQAPEGVHWVLIQSGIMDADEHSDLYDRLRGRGW